MTKVINGIVFIEPEPNDVCELCGKTEELRPYGPNGERVCFDCGMKNEPAARTRMGTLLFGDKTRTQNPTSKTQKNN